MLILILLILLAGGDAALAQDTFTGVDRVIAVGDVHGDYEAFVTVLRSAEVIDKKGKWTAGKTHLVQTGDTLDRGAESRKVMDLLMALEKQAAKAGGRVHSLIGNHEAMNIYGDLRYVVPGEFAAFKTGDSAQVREAYWQEQLKLLPAKPDKDAKKKWEEEHPLGWVEHRIAFSANGDYGKWLRTHNTAVKINDSLFLHGGIGPKYATTPLPDLNAAILSGLIDFTKIKDGDIITGDDGPLWYRGLASGSEAELAPHVEQVLKAYGVSRIVVGHTPTQGKIVSRFGGKVVVIDIGMAAAFGSRGRSCLLIENGAASAVENGQKTPLTQ